jgi:hypothetical protein
MSRVRAAFKEFVEVIDSALPSGPDKTFVLRQLRDSAMGPLNDCPKPRVNAGFTMWIPCRTVPRSSSSSQ